MTIKTKRVYDPPQPDDGKRILVDRLWPRGLSREAANIDLWVRELAPSNELRKWYGHDPEKWEEFKSRYRAELQVNQTHLTALLNFIGNGRVTLLYSSKENEINNATALRAYIEAEAGN